MHLDEIIREIADILLVLDSQKPVHKEFHAGIGPFGEPQLVKEISARLNMLAACRSEKQFRPRNSMIGLNRPLISAKQA